MKSAFISDVKQEMPPWIARIYAVQIADGSQVLYERFINELMARMKDVTNLIDVGCGPGHVAELLARKIPGGEVVGVDLSDVLIGIAKQKREPLNNLQFKLGTALDLKYPEGNFDAAISVNSIKAWPDRQAGVKEMTRTVRLGGWVALFECDPDCSKEAAQNFCSTWLLNMGLPGHLTARMGRAWYFRRFVAKDGARHGELRSFLENAGLTEVESFSYSDQPFAFAIGRK